MLLGLVSSPIHRDHGGGDPPPDFDPMEMRASLMGIWLLVATLFPIFASIGIWVVWLRAQNTYWPPQGSPPLPNGLWFSTFVVVALSAVMYWATRELKRGSRLRLSISLGLALVLGFAFLLSQTLNWLHAYRIGVPDLGRQFIGLVAFFTVIHALHVVGGVAALVYVGVLMLLGRSRARIAAPVICTAIYWHFIDIVWVSALALILIPG